ncbi:MAG: hypothetical protein GY940_06810 [bacterium]|nr:hypothetical protein [bacterium]
MDNNQDTFNTVSALDRLKQHVPSVEVGGDFENMVFAKIKHKKKQRKITLSASLGVLLAGVLFIGQAMIFNTPVATTQDSMPVSLANKEEVPVVEDVVFASSDSRSDYVVEQVGSSGEDNSI